MEITQSIVKKSGEKTKVPLGGGWVRKFGVFMRFLCTD